MNSPASSFSFSKVAGIIGVTSLAVVVGYGLSRPTSYETETSVHPLSSSPRKNSNNPINLSDEQRELIRNRIMKTYSYLSASLFTSGLSAYLLYKSEISFSIFKIMQKHPILYGICSSLCSIILLFSTRLTSYRHSKLLKHILWLCFNLSISQSLSIFGCFGSTIIVQSLLLSSSILGAISLIAISAPNNKFLKYGSLLGVGLGLLCGVNLLSYFYPSSKILNSLQIYGGLTVFGLFTAFDTQKVLQHAQNNLSISNQDEQTGQEEEIFDPINEQIDLYLDFINFFIYIVRLLLEKQETEKEKEENKRRKQNSNR